MKYLRQPLYFEVELMESLDPNLELIVENCWATRHEDRTSLPSWDIIVDRWNICHIFKSGSTINGNMHVLLHYGFFFFPFQLAVRTMMTPT